MHAVQTQRPKIGGHLGDPSPRAGWGRPAGGGPAEPPREATACRQKAARGRGPVGRLHQGAGQRAAGLRLLLLPLLLVALSASACAEHWNGSVGVVLARENQTGRLRVRDAPRELSGARAGLRVGDEIVAIDGHAVDRMEVALVRERLRGEVGSSVRLRIRRAGKLLDVVVERGPLGKDPKH